MRHILASVVLVVFQLPSLASGETMEDLVYRDGLYYKKFTNVPFTGKTTGEMQGTFRNGEKDGPWVEYHDNGQLSWKATYKNGELDGPWEGYHKDGTVDEKWTGTFKNGVKISD